uniref:Acyl-CoAsterol O-acyltransferase 1 n=1 Tax=Rhizophora mucronata TaxID=61149 RepID=A0A2P2PJH8_RHIMU
MEGNEVYRFMLIWFSVSLSLCYCYAIGRTIPKGKTRLSFLLPIVCFFLYLPLNLSTIHLCGITSFFVAWLANFKLLLFAFGKGPLSSHSSITSLPRFLAVACLPIKIQDKPCPKSQNGETPPPRLSKLEPQKSPINYATKGTLLAVLVRVYDYKESMHPKILLFLYCFHIYVFLEMILAMVAFLARAVLGLELEPQFNEPYLSTSLQDFWGRRWNLMVSRILRPTVYEPTIDIGTRVIGRKWAPIPAIWSTFFVSALMHELLFYYLSRLRPTWEVARFFILHGFLLTAEIALKKACGSRWRLPRMISRPFTVGFVIVTSFWLFFPQLLNHCRAEVRAFEEYAAVGEFIRIWSRGLLVR